MSRAEFLAMIDADLKKWISGEERELKAWLYSVEEWACQRQGEEFARELREASE